MNARIALTLIATIALLSTAAAELTTATDFGPATVRLEPAEPLYVTREATLALPAGETTVSLPLSELGATAGETLVEVAPADCVSIVSSESHSDTAQWRLASLRDTEATLSVTYPVSGLTWSIAYDVTVLDDGSASMQALLRLSNGLGRDLNETRFVGDRIDATLTLPSGEAITVAQPALSATLPAGSVEQMFVYDHALYGDTAVRLLRLTPQAGGIGALPAGRARIYHSAQTGRELVAEADLPATPPGAPVELSLGPASGLVVTRSLEESKEVDKRLDARNRVVLYDLLERWALEVRNLRAEPVTLFVRQRHEGSWSLEESNIEMERTGAERLEWQLNADPDKLYDMSWQIRHHNRQP
ncbi:MAG: hypothetical protein GX131_12020 [candidate division WS1 bacterium]|jgi:hypothetical protein|nr:hypothetical protein [candidate division WS1 bacterium]